MPPQTSATEQMLHSKAIDSHYWNEAYFPQVHVTQKGLKYQGMKCLQASHEI